MKKFPIRNSSLRWLETLLSERFGHEWCLSTTDRGIELRLAGTSRSILFDTLCDRFTRASSDLPSSLWDPRKEGLISILGLPIPAPGVYSLPLPLIEQQNEDYVIHYDILGFCYWMLARVEEIGRTDLDKHQRFPAKSSHAYNHGYLERPIVDEWLYILGQVISRQWPGLQLERHNFQMRVSHDVDRPSRYGFANLQNVSRRMVGDAVRGNLFSALSGPWVWLNSNSRLHPFDRFNRFDWIMDQSEYYGLTSAFYFICGHSSPLDGDYDIEHPAMRILLRQIHNRGHEIGLHPSYNTFDRPEALKVEADRLKSICAEEGIKQKHWGGRMHYLRWRHPATLRAWDGASMDYDSTLGYADHAGFRCGTCFEYPAYDPVEDVALSVRVRPLIAMEGSVLSEEYMGRSESDALEVLGNLKSKCQKLNGNFTLLWHNSELTRWQRLYSEILRA